MLLNSVYYCNICKKSTKEEPKVIFIQAVFDSEDIHICTACIPKLVHGNGDGVMSNKELKERLSKNI